MAETAEQPLDAGTFAGHAVLRINEMTPEECWAAITPNTRRWWLDMAGQPLGWRNEGWGALPVNGRKRLRLTMQQVMVFLTGAGLDLSGLRG